MRKILLLTVGEKRWREIVPEIKRWELAQATSSHFKLPITKLIIEISLVRLTFRTAATGLRSLRTLSGLFELELLGIQDVLQLRRKFSVDDVSRSSFSCPLNQIPYNDCYCYHRDA